MKEISRKPEMAVNEAEVSIVTKARQARTRQRIIVNTLRIGLLIVLVGGWELLSRLGIIDSFFWGQPSGIWAQLVTWVTQGTAQGPLWVQISATLEETFIGFVIGVVLGVISGVVLGRNYFLADILSPYIKAANAIPRVVLGSIFAIGLGLGIQSKIALAVVLVFFIVFFNAFQGVREVDRNLIANARLLGASSRKVSTEVIIPSALTWIIASLHTSFSFALVGAVVGEFIGSTEGLGLMIESAQANFNANGVFAAMAILAAVALIMEFLVTSLENRLITWRPNTVKDVTI
ncbi:binding-protein-dependent transport systems inner membrane component [Ktedonobacter racemifer DSM 44963]|uniref:Binding-protein-dependent transport systems inner membrane component n=2 Tax=Ktedonobacter racemifer TaxID=363277 RepID=D6U4T9_KTERA|nr:binding-protein-dependent transport systems inner membrane component [Ktedonobacter racemifer DSM 44963]